MMSASAIDIYLVHGASGGHYNLHHTPTIANDSDWVAREGSFGLNLESGLVIPKKSFEGKITL